MDEPKMKSDQQYGYTAEKICEELEDLFSKTVCRQGAEMIKI